MAIIPLVFAGMLLADDRLDGAGAAALVGIAIVSAVLAVLGGDIRRIRRIGPGGLELGPEEEAAVDTAISRLTAGLPLLKEHLEAGFHVPGKPRLVGPLLSPDTCGGKTAIPFFIRIAEAFKIPFAVLADLDPGKPPQPTDDLRKACPADRLFLLDPDFEGACGYVAGDKVVDAHKHFTGLALDDMPEALRKAVERVEAL